MKRRSARGFTIVEIIIVVVVIAILSIVTATIYANVQVQARDTKMRDAAEKLSDAVKLWSVKHGGVRPLGGYDSSSSNSYDAAAENCALSTARAGWIAAKMGTSGSTYACTIGDVLVNTGYLPATFFTDIDSPAVPYLKEFMVPTCGAADTSSVYLLYVVEEPSPAEVSAYDALAASCSIAGSYRTSYNMNTFIEAKIQ